MSKDFLPSGWVSRTLEDVVEINPRLDKKLFSDDMDISFVPMSAVETENGKIDISEIRSFGDVKKGYTAFQEKDVLFAKITPCMENGKMAVVPKLKNNLGFGSTEFHVLRSLTNILPEYIYYFVSSKQFRIDAEHNMTGAVGQRRVPTTYFQNVSIPLPEYAEQKNIVAKIEELFSELDSGIASLKTAQEQLKIYRQALLKHAFEGKLTEQWRKDNASKLETPEQLLARIQTERETRYQQQLDEWKQAVKDWEAKGKEGKKPSKPQKFNSFESTFDSEVQALPTVPKNWCFTTLGEFIDQITAGKSFKCEEREPSNDEIGVAKVSAVTWGEYNEAESKTCTDPTKINSDYFIKTDDFIFSRANTIELVGACVITKKVTKKIMLSDKTLRINFMDINKLYVLHYLRSHFGRKEIMERSTGNQESMRNIGQERIKSIVIPICSLDEQQEIVNQLEEKLSIIEQNEKEIESALAKAELLRQSILKKAFSGQLCKKVI